MNNFVSESALEEKRRLRQEEWDKVRKPEDPAVAPEEPYDSRSLYDRLKEQKDKKQEEWDEAHKLKNMVRGLDDDEAGFLDLVDQTKLAEESRILKEENEELEEYRKAVAKEQEERLLMEIKSIPNTPSAPLKVDSGNSVSLGLTKTSQKNHLQAFVKRKSTDKDGNSVKRTKSEVEVPIVPELNPTNDLKCIAVLPGIGCYGDGDTSDSESDTDSSDLVSTKQTGFDLCGRPLPHADEK